MIKHTHGTQTTKQNISLHHSRWVDSLVLRNYTFMELHPQKRNIPLHHSPWCFVCAHLQLHYLVAFLACNSYLVQSCTIFSNCALKGCKSRGLSCGHPPTPTHTHYLVINVLTLPVDAVPLPPVLYPPAPPYVASGTWPRYVGMERSCSLLK